jgi:hypothetical protein
VDPERIEPTRNTGDRSKSGVGSWSCVSLLLKRVAQLDPDGEFAILTELPSPSRHVDDLDHAGIRILYSRVGNLGIWCPLPQHEREVAIPEVRVERQ